jgi:hypothetical protein
MLLNDEGRFTDANRFVSLVADPEWQVELEPEAKSGTVSAAIRLLNRMLGRFSSETGLTQPVQIRQESILKYLRYEPSTNPLDLLGAEEI